MTTGAPTAEIVVGAGQLVASPHGVLTTYALGSCVAICLIDIGSGVGGLAHVLMPNRRPNRPNERPAAYADTGLPALLGAMEDLGARTRGLQCRIVGGANVLGMRLDMGAKNIAAVRTALAQHSIPILSEEIGGSIARSVAVDISTNRVQVVSPGQEARWLF